MRTHVIVLVVVLSCTRLFTNALTPRESESREILSLDGLWDFIAEPEPHVGTRSSWHLQRISLLEDAQLMPVPSSYNDVTQDPKLRDHIGVVWYQRCVILPKRFLNQSRRVVLHFGSVNYLATVVSMLEKWINDERVIRHEGGHLPFEADISRYLSKNADKKEQCITVSVNNTLTHRTIPQGRIFRPNSTDTRYPHGYERQNLEFDFFNYAGIHRSVVLYTTPRCFLHELTISTSLQPRAGDEHVNGILHYDVEFNCSADSAVYYNLIVKDAADEVVMIGAFLRKLSGQLEIEKPNLWWPHLSHGAAAVPAYQYTLEIQLVPNNNVDAADIYRTKFGIRSLQWTNSSLFINGKPFNFHGFGRHEDIDVKGRGLDVVFAWHDGYLMSWLGANSYRTSHYPYSEESLDVADYFGFVVIAETPAVGLNNFSAGLLKQHMLVTRELVTRDKNRPSVVMWSLANEPASQLPPADAYFKALAGNLSTWDTTRPITFVTSQKWNTDVAAQHVDVICFNRYSGWYGDGGRLELVERQTFNEVRRWREKFNKPVIVTEYGAGAIAGLHSLPSSIWTEDYQTSIMYEHFSAFDKLYAEGYFLGEMVWNFADFATPQEVIRPTGCMKGVFTRNRYPKQVAHVLKRRYWRLAQIFANAKNATENNVQMDK